MRTGEPIAAAKSALRSMPRARLVVEPVDATKAPLGQRHGRLGREREPGAFGSRTSLDRARPSALVVGHVARREAELEPAPGAALEALGDLSGSGAALSSGMAAEPVDIERYSLLERADAEA